MRFALLALLLSACAVAVDDFERCEVFAPDPVEQRSCTSMHLTCVAPCFDFEDEASAIGCIEDCDLPPTCSECVFQSVARCAYASVCVNEYQDATCCALEYCPTNTSECQPCDSTFMELNACVERSTMTACPGELILECFQET